MAPNYRQNVSYQIDRIDLETPTALELGHMKRERPHEAMNVAKILEILADAINIEVTPTVLVEQSFDGFVLDQSEPDLMLLNALLCSGR